MAIKKVATGDWIGGEFVHQPWASGTDQVGDPDGNVIGSAAASGWVKAGVVVQLDTITDSVGIGTLTPLQKLHVQGAIVIGTKTADVAGAIQWTGTHFQGYDGSSWVNLDDTGGGGSGSLDDAYNLGRTIIADAGPMILTSTSASALQIDQSVSGVALDINCTHATANGIDLSMTTGVGITGVTTTGKLLDFRATGTTTVNPMMRLALDASTYTGVPWAVQVDYSAATINTPVTFGAIHLAGRTNGFVGAYTAAVYADANWDYSLFAGSNCLIGDDKVFYFGNSRSTAVWYETATTPHSFNIQGVNLAGATDAFDFLTGDSSAASSGYFYLHTGDAAAGAGITASSGRVQIYTGAASVSDITAIATSGEIQLLTGAVTGTAAGAISSGLIQIKTGDSASRTTIDSAKTGSIEIKTGATNYGIAGTKARTGTVLIQSGDGLVWSSGDVTFKSGDVTTGNVAGPRSGHVTIKSGDVNYAYSGDLLFYTGSHLSGVGLRGSTQLAGREVYVGGETSTSPFASRIAVTPVFGDTTAPRIGGGSNAPNTFSAAQPPNSTGWPDGSLYLQTSAGGKMWLVKLNIWTEVTVP